MGALRTVYLDTVAPGRARKSAEKVNAGQLVQFPQRLPMATMEFDAAVARLVDLTFPGPSRNAQAEMAAQALGISPDTATRLLARETARIDARTVFALLGLYQARHGRAFVFGLGLSVALLQDGGAE